MSKALFFTRLDFITVRPYFTLKNLAIMIAAPLIIMASTGAAITTVGMFIIFTALYISYPFIVCEKNGMDALYTTLSITRKTVVLGRYLFTLALNLCAGIVGLGFTLIIPLIMRKTVSVPEMLLISLVMLIIVSIIEAVQLPIYFKLGYEKAKLLAYLPFIGFFLASLALKPLLDAGMPVQVTGFLAWIEMNPYLSVMFGVLIWFGLMTISYQLSVSYYSKRDF